MSKWNPLKFFKTPSRSLAELDFLFKDCIVSLPSTLQLEYCERVIDAAKYQLNQDISIEKRKNLKELISAAVAEIKRIETEMG